MRTSAKCNEFLNQSTWASSVMCRSRNRHFCAAIWMTFQIQVDDAYRAIVSGDPHFLNERNRGVDSGKK